MKEIPKREGQKLQGTTPSVFALAFLIIGVPLISSLIVNMQYTWVMKKGIIQAFQEVIHY